MDRCDLEEDNYLGNEVFFLLGINTEIMNRIFTKLFGFELGYWECKSRPGFGLVV